MKPNGYYTWSAYMGFVQVQTHIGSLKAKKII